jgi:hypothetical protein
LLERFVNLRPRVLGQKGKVRAALIAILGLSGSGRRRGQAGAGSHAIQKAAAIIGR